MKARVQTADLASFEGTEQLPGGFQVPMLLLAIVIGTPREAAILFPRLQQHTVAGNDPVTALLDFKTLSLEELDCQKLEAKLGPIVSESSFPEIPISFWMAAARLTILVRGRTGPACLITISST